MPVRAASSPAMTVSTMGAARVVVHLRGVVAGMRSGWSGVLVVKRKEQPAQAVLMTMTAASHDSRQQEIIARSSHGERVAVRTIA
jgi:hypothetical protein